MSTQDTDTERLPSSNDAASVSTPSTVTDDTQKVLSEEGKYKEQAREDRAAEIEENGSGSNNPKNDGSRDPLPSTRNNKKDADLSIEDPYAKATKYFAKHLIYDLFQVLYNYVSKDACT